ncbi:MAG: type II toxin-antitoxin system VapC family toxin [Candidatus Bipolaricaulota bacterium]
MRYWDSSALLPLLIQEETTNVMGKILAADPSLLVWWGSAVECAFALCRFEREGNSDADGVSAALERLVVLRAGWHEVQPSDMVRENAVRLLRAHDLRAADVLQLAAAVVASEGHPHSLPFVCLDARLRRAADREGFPVEPARLR